MAGRRPKPTALHELHGTDREDRKNHSEPKPPELRHAQAPRQLGKLGRKTWHKLVPLLEQIKVVKETDRIALAVLCHLHESFHGASELVKSLREFDLSTMGEMDLEDKLQAIKIVIEGTRDAQTKQIAFAKELRMYLGEFGLTPSSRRKVHAEESGDEDPIAALMNG